MRALLLTCVLFMAVGALGCAGGGGPWAGGNRGPVDVARGGPGIRVPSGWLRSTTADGVLITREGLEFGWIHVTRRSGTAAYPHLHTFPSPDATPAELMTLDRAELEERTGVALQELSAGPVIVGGKAGYRLHVEYRDAGEVRVQRLSYGYVLDGDLVHAEYVAPRLLYFDQDLATFEAMVESLQ